MAHYRTNLRDIQFNLFEMLGTDEYLGGPAFPEMDTDSAKELLTQLNEVAIKEVAPTLIDGDRNPPVYDPAEKTVTMSEDFKRIYNLVYDLEGWRVDLPTDLGGVASPPSLRWSLAELVVGSSPALFFYMGGPTFARILHGIGNEEQRGTAQLMVEKGWGATMVLTEPDAGSDVGAGTTKAILQDDGSYHIEGVKRFITSAEHDITDNIIHLVLARPVNVEGAGGPGTKGLSLFVVPKFLFDPQSGELGERNGVYTTNVEKKMGLKASTTCELTLGAEHPAIGYLVGDVHDGINQMFRVIEYARMMVGTKAMATLSTGYLNALDYAKEREQGADLTQMLDKSAPRVSILAHPDVRRSLMLQKSYSEGLRALVLYTAWWQDQIARAEAGEGAIDKDLAERMNDLLLPIVKGVGSERAYEMLAQSLQTLGGSGYLQDYPIEQYLRDAKIDTLYEGTTAIQGLDFFFRKMVRDQFKAVFHLGGLINETVKGGGGQDTLTQERELLATALDDVQQAGAKLGEWAMESQNDINEIYRVGLNTTRLLMMFGDLVIGWLLIRQAEVAQAALDAGASGSDQAFYEGKVAAARWFAHNRFPLLTAEKDAALGTSLDIMELSPDAF